MRKSADILIMSLKDIFPILFSVMKNKYVIGTAIVVLIYLEFVRYVINYRKRPKRKKDKKKIIAAPAPQEGQAEAPTDNTPQAAESDGI